MFEDDDDSPIDDQLNQDLQQFEAHLFGENLGFIDSDRLEAVIDHYLLSGEFTKAKKAAEIGRTNFSYNPIFDLRFIQSLSGLKQFDEALVALSRINTDQIPPLELYITFAAIYMRTGTFDLAATYLVKALSVCEVDDKPDLFLDLALAKQKQRDFDGAILVLEEALSDFSNHEAILYELGFLYDRIGNYDQSIAIYLRYLEESPYANMAWYNLGNAYSKIENFEKAIWAYDYSILAFDEFSPVYFNMGNAYLSTEKYHQAIDCFKKVLSIDGDDPMALCYLGEAHEQLKEFDVAENYYHLCLSLDPKVSEAWLGLGIISDIKGNTVEAIKLIKKAISFDEDNASNHLVLANAYHKCELRDEAEEHYVRSIELDPEDAECLQDFVLFLLEDSPLNALTFMENFQLDIENNPYFMLMYVHVLVHANRIDDAVLLFSSLVMVDREQAMKIIEWNPKLAYHKDFVNLLHE